MKSQTEQSLRKEIVDRLLPGIAPGSRLIGVQALPGSYSNFTHLVQMRSSTGALGQLVVRRYARHNHDDRGEKARREFKMYQLLADTAVPVPRPLFLDESGALLGTPGIVTAYLPGRQIHAPPDPLAWAEKLARALVNIHAVEIAPAEHDHLLDANVEAVWFLRDGDVPQFMQQHPLGVAVWRAVSNHYPNLKETATRLIHLDYWPGNVLWVDDEISGVIDWEEAAYGDPAVDVAYLQMNMALDGYDEAAAALSTIYENQAGYRLVNLDFWKLAAAARPMMDLAGWELVSPPKSERFERFIQKALEGVAYSFEDGD